MDFIGPHHMNLQFLLVYFIQTTVPGTIRRPLKIIVFVFKELETYSRQ